MAIFLNGSRLETEVVRDNLYKDIVLKNPEYVKLIISDTYTHKTYYMGLVDAATKVNFYSGDVRVVSPVGTEVARFAPRRYLDYVGEHVEPHVLVERLLRAERRDDRSDECGNGGESVAAH